MSTADVVNQLGSTMVFCRTRHGADRLARQLEKLGVKAAPIHGGRSQPQRDRALKAFQTGAVSALVATDVAARGVHVDDVAGRRPLRPAGGRARRTSTAPAARPAPARPASSCRSSSGAPSKDAKTLQPTSASTSRSAARTSASCGAQSRGQAPPRAAPHDRRDPGCAPDERRRPSSRPLRRRMALAADALRAARWPSSTPAGLRLHRPGRRAPTCSCTRATPASPIATGQRVRVRRPRRARRASRPTTSSPSDARSSDDVGDRRRDSRWSTSPDDGRQLRRASRR